MKWWKKIKRIWHQHRLNHARAELFLFQLEFPKYKPHGTHPWPAGLAHIDDRIEYKKKLAVDYAYPEGADLLTRKQDFIDKYTKHERAQFDYFITNNLYNCNDEIRTRVWREHEQVERFRAQCVWHKKVVHGSYRNHMRQKFMNQKTR